MNRCYFGAVLLALLLVLSLGTTWAVRHCLEPVTENLDRAVPALLQENWAEATGLVRSAWGNWRKTWRFSASVSDHGPMEAIDGLFAKLSVCLESRNAQGAAAICVELARQVEAIADAHEPSWWNFL